MEKKIYEIGKRIRTGEKTTFAERNIYFIELKKQKKLKKQKDTGGRCDCKTDYALKCNGVECETKQKEVLG